MGKTIQERFQENSDFIDTKLEQQMEILLNDKYDVAWVFSKLEVMKMIVDYLEKVKRFNEAQIQKDFTM